MNVEILHFLKRKSKKKKKMTYVFFVSVATSFEDCLQLFEFLNNKFFFHFHVTRK